MALPNCQLKPPAAPWYYDTAHWKPFSFNGQRGEYAFRRMAMIEWETEKAMVNIEKVNSDPNFGLCLVCSNSKSPIYDSKRRIFHRHFSSLIHRANITPDVWGQHFCPSCRRPHYTMAGDSYNVLLTSSTMNNWRTDEYEGDKIHTDSIGIPGGSIRDLHHAIVAEYRRSPKPLNVLVVSGINDILRGRPVEHILDDMYRLKCSVMKWNDVNLVAFSTIFTPPKLFTERSAVFALNNGIMDLNEEGPRGDLTRFSPRFHSWGLKSGTNKQPELFSTMRGNILANKSGYNYNAFRETMTEDMLHLNDTTRVRMGRAIVNYFMAVCGLMENAGERARRARQQASEVVPQGQDDNVQEEGPADAVLHHDQPLLSLSAALNTIPDILGNVPNQAVKEDTHAVEVLEDRARSTDNNAGSDVMNEVEIDQMLDAESYVSEQENQPRSSLAAALATLPDILGQVRDQASQYDLHDVDVSESRSTLNNVGSETMESMSEEEMDRILEADTTVELSDNEE